MLLVFNYEFNMCLQQIDGTVVCHHSFYEPLLIPFNLLLFRRIELIVCLQALYRTLGSCVVRLGGGGEEESASPRHSTAKDHLLFALPAHIQCHPRRGTALAVKQYQECWKSSTNIQCVSY